MSYHKKYTITEILDINFYVKDDEGNLISLDEYKNSGKEQIKNSFLNAGEEQKEKSFEKLGGVNYNYEI